MNKQKSDKDVDSQELYAAFDLDYNDGLPKATIKAIKSHMKNNRHTKIRLKNAKAGEKTRFAALTARKTRSKVVACCPVSFTLQRRRIKFADDDVLNAGSAGCTEGCGEFFGVALAALAVFVVGIIAEFLGVRSISVVLGAVAIVVVAVLVFVIVRK